MFMPLHRPPTSNECAYCRRVRSDDDKTCPGCGVPDRPMHDDGVRCIMFGVKVRDPYLEYICATDTKLAFAVLKGGLPLETAKGLAGF